MLFSDAQAQSAVERAVIGAEEIKTLQIGDTLPETLWNLPLHVVNHPDGKDAVTLSDYRDKTMIILDFWATWCTSCIKNFPKLYELQRNDSSIQTILINSITTRDTRDKIAGFLHKRRQAYSMPSVVSDTILSKLFPHQSLPHYVLIADGKIAGIIDGGTSDMVDWQKISKGDYTVQQAKGYREYDFRYPLFHNGNGGNRPQYLFGSFLSHYIEGLPSAIYKGGSNTQKVSLINVPLITILRFAHPSLSRYRHTRIVYNVTDPLLFSERKSDETRNLFTYEIETPSMPQEDVARLVAEDLQRYMPLEFNSIMKEVECWVLTAVKPELAVDFPDTLARETNLYEKSSAPIFYNNYRLENLLKYLEGIYNIPFVDETCIKQNVRLVLPPDLHNSDELKRSLRRYGLELKLDRRKLDMMEIVEKQTN
ncbi:hypothetical protein C4F40_19850 [Sphingobacterium sp. Ka21]|uniref:Thioredoxin domain-containing protein n=1 Tax=Sphingobacterium pedocola TaxID=2082722 RepID=A0ABR9TDP1_9SPHI|nr:hypothetical protein [Sphingobacterium pedocola]